ncbi:MAG: ribosomal L7Ae/L30e/S12e/Gadd45 family protein [Candidatus Woesearchaeota archaeon]
MVKQLSEEQVEEVYNIVEVARATGKIRKGVNEATKSIERGIAQLVIYAKDASPSEIILHLGPLSDDKGVVCVEVPSKEELGTAAGLQIATAAVVVIDAGEAQDKLKALAP